MKHLEELVEKLKALPKEELTQLLQLLKEDEVVTLEDCPKGYVKDSHGNCTPDLGNP
jgi:hypothetical protein